MRSALLALALLNAGCTSCTTKSEQHPRLTVSQVVGGVPVDQNRNAKLGYPADDGILISRDQFLISWNSAHRELNWSVWQLSPSDMGDSGRSNDFEEDPDLARVATNAVLPDEYKGSCLDRGHQTPSADRTDSRTHNLVTFYMSNMIPQSAHLNRGVWEHFEEHERELVKGGQTVFVYAGPIFAPNAQGIGPRKDITVPAKNFKIIASATGTVLSAVIMPNLTSTGTDPVKDHDQACADSRSTMLRKAPLAGWTDWQEYVTSLADIEAQSGLKFPFLHSN